MAENTPRRVLVAPLDWGLGHTTRCIPIIRHLQLIGCQVIVACNNWQKAFIENTFNCIEFVHLEGYNISYSDAQRPAKTTNIKLVPQVYKAVKREQKWLHEHFAVIRPDAIISDNRYGLYTNKIPCAIITHQLQIQTGMGTAANKVLQQLHYRLLEKFGEVWVPDVAGTQNLAGNLSHSNKLPANTRYIGLLSQFENETTIPENKGYLLVLLSGPEPQRTMLSTLLWKQLKQYNGRVIFVAGSHNAVTPEGNTPVDITFYSALSGKMLAETIAGADMIVCRSGYSTLMDLILLGKKAILIPTPGQTEQEYLAMHLQSQGIFPYYEQHSFDLTGALAAAKNFSYNFPSLTGSYMDYIKVVEDWLK